MDYSQKLCCPVSPWLKLHQILGVPTKYAPLSAAWSTTVAGAAASGAAAEAVVAVLLAGVGHSLADPAADLPVADMEGIGMCSI